MYFYNIFGVYIKYRVLFAGFVLGVLSDADGMLQACRNFCDCSFSFLSIKPVSNDFIRTVSSTSSSVVEVSVNDRPWQKIELIEQERRRYRMQFDELLHDQDALKEEMQKQKEMLQKQRQKIEDWSIKCLQIEEDLKSALQ